MAQPRSDAKSVLKAMYYMSSQKTIEITFDSAIEVITPQLEKIQFTNSNEMLLNAPDKLRAHRVGGYADVALYFDGKTVSVFGKHINGYAQFDAPGTVDHLIETLVGPWCRVAGREPSPARIPMTSSLPGSRNPSISTVASSMAWCGHLAFRNFDTDWQLWVEVGKEAHPRANW